MRRFIVIIIFLILTVAYSFAQDKKPLSEEAYFSWNNIEKAQISDDGAWVVYELNPNKGDGKLIVHEVATQKNTEIERAKNAYIDSKNNVLVAFLSPSKNLLDSLARKKQKDLPTDTLLITNLLTGATTLVPRVKKYEAPPEWKDWIFYTVEHVKDTLVINELPRKPAKDEALFIAHNLPSDTRDTILYVTSFVFSKKSPRIFVQENSSDSIPQSLVTVKDLSTSKQQTVYNGMGKIKNLVASENGASVSFLVDTDTSAAPIRLYDLFVWNEAENRTAQAVPKGC